MRCTLLACCFLGLAACQRPAPAAPAAAEADLVVLSQAQLHGSTGGEAALVQLAPAYEHALGNGDAALAAQLHAPDAVLIPPGAPAVRGREAIAGALARLYPQAQPLAVAAVEAGVARSGDLAYVVSATADMRGPGASVSVLRKTPEGWRVVVSTWSRDAP